MKTENTALQNLKNLFQDSPDVLRMLDLLELDLTGLESEALIKAQKDKQLFPEPVNFYATGRTGAGKTSLGNSLLDLSKPIMESHGHIDCTNSVQYLKFKSNLRYFDLPGAGSNEDNENINRAALLIEQLQDEDDIPPVTEFKVLDFSEILNEGVNGKLQERIIEVKQWQSDDNQKNVSPDIILYLVAPHTQFIRSDRIYLKALLKSLKERGCSNKVIFALNIHSEGERPKFTPQNIQDARTIITDIYKEYYPNEEPLIAEINSLKGTGLSLIAEFICSLLPQNKIGNMKQVLQGELKEVAKKERSRRYLRTLIHVASRLATYPVDALVGKGIVEEIYAAICDYGIRIFIEENTCLQTGTELHSIIDSLVATVKNSRKKATKIIVPDIEEHEITENKVVDKNPQFEEVEVKEQYIEYEQVPTRSYEKAQIGAAIGMTVGTVVGKAIGVPWLGYSTGYILGSLGGLNSKTTETKPVVKERTKIEEKFKGFEEVREDVTTTVQHIVYKEQEVGTEYLQGGYPVIENLLAIGLSIETANSYQDLLQGFEDVVKTKRTQVQDMLGDYKEEINKLAESCTTPETRKQTEQQILKILEQNVLNVHKYESKEEEGKSSEPIA